MNLTAHTKSRVGDVWVVLIASAIFACGDSDETAPSADVSGADVGLGDTTVDANEGSDASDGADAASDTETRACSPPEGPFGTSEGRRFLPFTLDDCNGDPFEFYGEAEGYCDASLTVFSMAAGWCEPCRVEAELMQELLVDEYADAGVRVVVAIIQDNAYQPPSLDFCAEWAEQYGLTNPILVDPVQESGIYFPGGALPATLIVDSEGTIVFREYGAAEQLTTLRAEIDAALGG